MRLSLRCLIAVYMNDLASCQRSVKTPSHARDHSSLPHYHEHNAGERHVPGAARCAPLALTRLHRYYARLESARFKYRIQQKCHHKDRHEKTKLNHRNIPQHCGLVTD